MDPATALGLAAACSSLVKACGGVVKTLHDLAEVYKDAELSILSMIEECENIRFAWTSLEDWANKYLGRMDNYEQLLERLQSSIYTGQLTMSALEEDLAKATRKTTNFRRRITFVWDAAVFHEHQNRIRGQYSALQLLLQVISM
jgi:phage shock protein A